MADVTEYAYQLILSQLIFDGFEKSVKILTSELKWTKQKKEISASDDLLQLIAATKSPSRQNKPNEKRSNKSDDVAEGEVRSDAEKAKEVTRVSERPKSKSKENNVEKITCKFCSCEFSRNAAYQRHLRKHKTETKPDKGASKEDALAKTPEENRDDNEKEGFNLELEIEGLKQENLNPEECEAADKETIATTTTEYESKEEHNLDAIEKEQLETLPKVRKRSGKQLHKVCSVCGTKFKLIKNLREHMQENHSDVKFSPYKCRECDASFDDAFKRYRHETKEHDGLHPKPTKPVCSFCGITLNASSLADHINFFHTGVKPYKCKYCDRRFVKGSHLTRHHRVHTGEKPYQCRQCDKKFADNSGLINHQAREHSSGDENTYKCTVCCKIYRSAADLKRHEKSHMANEDRPHHCLICGKRFTALSILKEHQRIHEGIKPYICQVCGKSFTQNAHLKYHLKIHNDDKPYKCDICQTGFRCAAARRKHLVSHANKRSIELKANEEREPAQVRKRKAESRKVSATKTARKEESSAGLQAAKGLVAMAAGQGTSDKSSQQIIIIAPSGGASEQKQYLLTSGGKLVQQVVVQQQVKSSVPNYIATGNAPQHLDGAKRSQSVAKPVAVQDVKLTEAAAKGDRSEVKTGQDSSESYELIYVHTSEEPRTGVEDVSDDQNNVVTRVLTQTVQSTGGQVAVSDNHDNVSGDNVYHAPILSNAEIHVTSVGEQVVSQQQQPDDQYVVMETDQQSGVYQAGDIVSLSMAASNVGHGGESEQLIQENTVGSEGTVVTSAQWT